ncbi:hypothetical protein [Polaromonas sp. CG9_12]|nr:hypothetical protein [Polaromonas sp. CG9_12]
MASAILFSWACGIDALQISHFFRFDAYSQAILVAIPHTACKRLQTLDIFL